MANECLLAGNEHFQRHLERLAAGGFLVIPDGQTPIIRLRSWGPNGHRPFVGFADRQRDRREPLWNSTAIIVVWDDWGGWYDHVAAPQLDYDGLGFRVPMLVISPYAKTGYVAHTQYEFGSILKFVEDTFNLGRLGTTDTRATSIDDAFDFTQSPRTFVPIQSKYSKTYFLQQRPSNEPVDTE